MPDAVTSGPRILAIASAANGCAAAIVRGDADFTVLAAAHTGPERGLPERIPELVAALITQAGSPSLVGVVVGPGSFTGLRAGIAVAQGVALGAGVDVVGVSVTEALAESLPHLDFLIDPLIAQLESYGTIREMRLRNGGSEILNSSETGWTLSAFGVQLLDHLDGEVGQKLAE